MTKMNYKPTRKLLQNFFDFFHVVVKDVMVGKFGGGWEVEGEEEGE
eukprot:CAMPEP_0201530624 /NCGR_PEP_ID=MMETSP0161_2-20130828/45241_1 /ASSEMBLY_ACC=CAM_ASM_000251 /TAXON_ID=180227 /ORGANISM="Neoparamoeba aestuarina, Strain SoJaBio B1-5/56/2" /LENGTH=45 /DNA_ID= /DNA_START= /DNA_END= /DNA_ORIENTATION=